MRKSRHGWGVGLRTKSAARTRLAAPRSVKVASAGPGGITLKWAAPKGAKPAHYVIFRDGKSLGKTTRSSFTDTKVVPGKTYRVRDPRLRQGQEGRRVVAERARHRAAAGSTSCRAIPGADDQPDRADRRGHTDAGADARPREAGTRLRPHADVVADPTPTATPDGDAHADADGHGHGDRDTHAPTPTATATPTPTATATATPTADRDRDGRRRPPRPPRPRRPPDRHRDGDGRPTQVGHRDGQPRRPPADGDAPTPTATATASPTATAHATATPTPVNPNNMADALVDRLFWRAGFGADTPRSGTRGWQEAEPTRRLVPRHAEVARRPCRRRRPPRGARSTRSRTR